MEKVGYAPTPVDFQSTASTKLASSPIGGRPLLFHKVFTRAFGHMCLQMDSNHRTRMRGDLQSPAIAAMRYRHFVVDIGLEPITSSM